uniref:Uncharacterized protein n=1 Tax=Zea mays TaxID=4577 RepID=G2XK62_MAIZE|nr:hypothetical protein rf1-C1-g3 [Zea mays]
MGISYTSNEALGTPPWPTQPLPSPADSGSHQVTHPLTLTLRTDVSILVVELRTTIRCPDRERWS